MTAFDRTNLRAAHRTTTSSGRARRLLLRRRRHRRTADSSTTSTRRSAAGTRVVRTAQLWRRDLPGRVRHRPRRRLRRRPVRLRQRGRQRRRPARAHDLLGVDGHPARRAEPGARDRRDGTIVAKTRNVYVKAFNPVDEHVLRPAGVGETIPRALDRRGRPDLRRERQRALRGQRLREHGPTRVIFGNAGEFQIKDTWDYVTITNCSDRQLVINDIDVVQLGRRPGDRDRRRQHPRPEPSTPANGVSAAPRRHRRRRRTFEFDIMHVFPPTQVQIANTAVGASAPRTSTSTATSRTRSAAPTSRTSAAASSPTTRRPDGIESIERQRNLRATSLHRTTPTTS